MKVRVKQGQVGFIYGSLRREGSEFQLKPVEHSTDVDKDGNPIIIPIEAQFSNVWMEKLEDEQYEPIAFSDMKAPELKDACREAGIDYEGKDEAIAALEAVAKSGSQE